MIVKMIGALIGLLIFGFGLYYLIKEKDDKESRTIYTVVSIVVRKEVKAIYDQLIKLPKLKYGGVVAHPEFYH
ncbi:putative uncharacterized protein [Clostridium sp. CAG:411]|nr:putative uncharacterized protein [Clostridium sp. CAG:411]